MSSGDEDGNQTTPTVSLALSGGGFRAAFFHLGVLGALVDQGRFGDVKFVVGVSGGALAGAILLNELAQVPGALSTNESAAECVARSYQKLLKFSTGLPRTASTLSFRALLSLLVTGVSGARSAMAREYRTLLAPSLKEALHGGGLLPELRIATIDYISGSSVIFRFNDRMEGNSFLNGLSKYPETAACDLADVLSAATAVPAAFEPLHIGPFQLGDGGIFDNLGLEELRQLPGQRICSDASASRSSFNRMGPVQTAVCAADLLMDQSRAYRLERAKDDDLLICPLRGRTPETAAVWKLKLRYMRTDLDEVTTGEAALLFLAGYQEITGASEIPKMRIRDRESWLWSFVSGNTSNLSSRQLKAAASDVEALDHSSDRTLSKATLLSWTTLCWSGENFMVFSGLLAVVMAVTLVALGLLARYGPVPAANVGYIYVIFVVCVWAYAICVGARRSMTALLRCVLIAPLVAILPFGRVVWFLRWLFNARLTRY